MVTLDTHCPDKVLEAFERELGAVKLPTDDRFQDLSQRQKTGTLTFHERDDLTRLMEQAARRCQLPDGVTAP